MSILVTNEHEATSNILGFQSHLFRNPTLASRLAYARAWYAHRNEDENWCFGPSKFIGYRGMTAKEYLNDEPRDGRRTERQLREWFVEIPAQNPLHAELSQELHAFLSKYGKAPSSLFRINVSRVWFEAREAQPSLRFHRAVADLLVLIGSQLPHGERARVRASL